MHARDFGERAEDVPTRTKNSMEREVLELLEMDGDGPEEIDLPTKCEVVSGARLHLSDPGEWRMKPALVSADRATETELSHATSAQETVRMSST